MALEVGIEAAYREACCALGDAQVRERLLLQHIAALEAAAAERSIETPAEVAPDGGGVAGRA